MYVMTGDIDKLMRGRDFETRRANKVIDMRWHELTIRFDADRLQYQVRMHAGDDEESERFDGREQAIKRFNELKGKYGLTE